jgi:hypothetical protein
MIVNPSHSINTTFPLISSAEKLSLLVDVNEQHLCIVRFDKENNHFEGLEYYYLFQFNTEEKVSIIQSVTKQYNQLKEQIDGVVVYYSTRNTLLVPQAVYHEDTSKWMVEHAIGVSQNEIICKENLKALDVVTLYPIPQYLHETMQQAFPTADFSHFNAEWIRKTIKIDRPNHLFEVLFFPRMVTIILWMDDQLQMVQSYPCENQEDILYYLLSVSTAFKISPETIETRLSGLIDTNSPIFDAIKKSFPNLKMHTRPSTCSYHPSFDEHPQHFFSPVLSLETCVS